MTDSTRAFGTTEVDAQRRNERLVMQEDPLTGKYAEFLKPFVKSMNKELHANCGKEDREGWLQMTPQDCMLEIYYHSAKLQKAIKDNDIAGVKEYTADVANMTMMMQDICGLLDV